MPDGMILVVFNSSIEEEMTEALKGAGMDCYTKLVNAQGVGIASDPRLDSHVWPGTNLVFLVVASDEDGKRILEAVRRMRDLHHGEGVKAFVLPVVSVV